MEQVLGVDAYPALPCGGRARDLPLQGAPLVHEGVVNGRRRGGPARAQRGSVTRSGRRNAFARVVHALPNDRVRSWPRHWRGIFPRTHIRATTARPTQLPAPLRRASAPAHVEREPRSGASRHAQQHRPVPGVVLVGEQVVTVAVWAQENEVPSSRARPSLATSGTRGTPAAAIASLPLTTRLANTAEQATLLVRAMLPAGLDTTVIVIGTLAHDPGRWALLREIPGNIRFAVAPLSDLALTGPRLGRKPTARRPVNGRLHTAELARKADRIRCPLTGHATPPPHTPLRARRQAQLAPVGSSRRVRWSGVSARRKLSASNASPTATTPVTARSTRRSRARASTTSGAVTA